MEDYQITHDKKKPNWFKRHKVWTSIIALFVLFVIIGAANGGNNQNTASKQVSSTPSTPSPQPDASATPAPAPQPTETVSQQNAVSKADEYLSTEAFSHDGLIGQLEYE